MPRPQKQTVDYFPHFANASEKKTLYILENKFGVVAYAFWFKLLEILAASPGHYFNFNNPAEWEFLTAKTKVSDSIGLQILDELALLDAIDPDLYRGKYIWSQNLVDGLAEVYRRRQLDLPQKPSLNNHKPLHNEVIDDINTTTSLVSTDENTQREEVEEVEEVQKHTIIFNHWNSKNIRVHRKLTDDAKRAINARSKDFTIDEILTSIDNYATILFGQEYGLMTYCWTLKEFLSGERVEKFLDLEIAKRNYLKYLKGDSNGAHRGNTKKGTRLPERYTEPPPDPELAADVEAYKRDMGIAEG